MCTTSSIGQGASTSQKAWDKLAPSKVSSLIADEATRTSVLGLVSFHRNGYVRHESVRQLARLRDGSELPFLLIRQNDWVEPISAEARESVATRLIDEYLPQLVHCLPLVMHLLCFRRYDHSSVVRRVVQMLVKPGHETALAEAIRSENRATRREVIRIALDLDVEHRHRVVELGLTSEDPVVRLWCAQRVRACYPATEMSRVVARLLRDRFMPVRREGLSVAADCLADSTRTVCERGLLDSSYSIRALARYHLKKLGEFDPASFYRNALSQHASLAALNGLGESGDGSDIPCLRAFLSSPLPSWRAAALRGIACLGKETVVGDLVEHLRDESPSVVREARLMLAPLRSIVDGDELLRVVMEGNSLRTRELVLRLIFEMGKWRSLPWLVRAVAHDDEPTAALARSLVEAWFTPRLCNRVFTMPSRQERQRIEEAVSKTRTAAAEPFFRKLEGWLEV